MRKFRLFILIIGIFSFLGLKKAKAATPEKIDVEIYYYINGVKESAFTTHLSGILVGEIITYNPQCYEGYQFIFWTVNEAVRRDLPQNLSIKARSKLVLKAHFISPNKKGALFLDTNMKLLGYSFAESGEAIPPANPVKNLATFEGWVLMDALDYESATPVTTFPLNELTSFYVAKYSVADSQTVNVNENDYVVNSVVTMTSPLDNPVWKNANGQIVGYGKTFKFTAIEDATFTASESDHIAGNYTTFRGPITTIRTGYKSYVGTFDVGTKEVLDFGFILSDGKKAQSNTFNQITGTNIKEFLMSFNQTKIQPIATYVSYYEGTTLVTKISSEEYKIASVRDLPAGTAVEFSGIITRLTGYEIAVSDGTAAITLYKPSQNTFSLPLGSKVIVRGTRDVYQGLIRIAEGAVVTSVASGHPRPIFNINTLENMSNRQSQHVTVSNLIPLYLSDDNRELTVMLGGWQTIIRSNAGTPAAIYYAVKDAISAKHIHLTNVFVDWDKDNHRPRLLVETIDQITVINYTEEEKVERIKNTLVSEYDNKQYFSLTNVELMTTHPTYGGIITWSYNPAEAVIDGKWRAINEQNTLVTATANITVGSATGTQDVSITIIYRDEEQLIYQTGFETAEGFGFLGGNEPYNHQDIYYSGPDNDWGTVNGTPSPDDRIAGFQSMQMRWYNNGYEIYTRTFFNLSKITKVTFKAKNTNNVNVTVYISRDGGTTWENPQTFILGQTAQEYTYLVPQSYRTNNLMRVKFTLTYNGSTPDVKLIIDDVKIYGMVAI